jgi:hypothetical protein
MPVRLLNPFVLRWPDAEAVDNAGKRWVTAQLPKSNRILRTGNFGSYARGNWGVGSDVDLILIVDSSNLPFERRPIEWDATALPVHSDLLVYTLDERENLAGRFRNTLEREAVRMYMRGARGEQWAP